MNEISDDGISKPMVEALVFYNDALLASKALGALKEVADGLEQGEWNVKCWRLDVLEIESVANEALADSEAVYLVVFALGPFARLSSGVMDWLSLWMRRRGAGNVALACFAETEDDRSSSLLAEFARLHGMTFLCRENLTDKHTVDLFGSLAPRRAPSSPAFTVLPSRKAFAIFDRRSGLNE